MLWSMSYIGIHLEILNVVYTNKGLHRKMSFFVIPVTALHGKLPFGIGNRAFPAIQGTWNMY